MGTDMIQMHMDMDMGMGMGMDMGTSMGLGMDGRGHGHGHGGGVHQPTAVRPQREVKSAVTEPGATEENAKKARPPMRTSKP